MIINLRSWWFNLISSQLFINMKTENHKSAEFQNWQTSESTLMYSYLAFNVNIGLNILFPLFKDWTWSGRDYISNNHFKNQRMQHKTLLSSIHREQSKAKAGTFMWIWIYSIFYFEFKVLSSVITRSYRQDSYFVYVFKIYDNVFLILT